MKESATCYGRSDGYGLLRGPCYAIGVHTIYMEVIRIV